MLLLVSIFFSVVGRASGWKDCLISPQDEWKEATEPIPAMRMRAEYDRGYTCTTSHEGSLMAANYYFDSPCLTKRFHPPELRKCLEGRRVIFLGDSLTNQQGDSLVGMLDWHPEWLHVGGFRNNKRGVLENGEVYYTLVDCWHPPGGSIGWIERCYDLYDTHLPLAYVATPRTANKPSFEFHISAQGSASKPGKHNTTRGPKEDEGQATDRDQEKDKSLSVHVRMTGRPRKEHWFSKAVLDYNETRASDIFVVNFGAHYPATPEDDEIFKQDMSPLLDEMAIVGETATVIWREMSPVHFPSENGTYVNFLAEDLDNANTVCCTGTPPKVLDRNVWVEKYLRENGLADKVKILRIYDMSLPRGAAHHTCYEAPPSTMDQTGTESDYCHSNYGPDCTHWSETGVVEEWNTLLLNHICPMNE